MPDRLGAAADLRGACICNTIMPEGRIDVSGCRLCEGERNLGR
ncbi:MAG: hypothetical protein ACREXT_19245 [Gammaproteobacteria bacterium]